LGFLPTLFLDGDDVALAPLIAERSIPGAIYSKVLIPMKAFLFLFGLPTMALRNAIDLLLGTPMSSCRRDGWQRGSRHPFGLDFVAAMRAVTERSTSIS
jgi:hypothetical protein